MSRVTNRRRKKARKSRRKYRKQIRGGEFKIIPVEVKLSLDGIDTTHMMLDKDTNQTITIMAFFKINTEEETNNDQINETYNTLITNIRTELNQTLTTAKLYYKIKSKSVTNTSDNSNVDYSYKLYSNSNSSEFTFEMFTPLDLSIADLYSIIPLCGII